MDRYYTENELNVLCKNYQKILRIQDWIIEVKIVHTADIENADGRHDSDLGQMRSLIRLSSPESRKFAYATPHYDMRQVLIHELIHIVFFLLGPKDDDVPTFDLWESGIDKISVALSELLPNLTYICSECNEFKEKKDVLLGINPDNPDYVQCINCAEKLDFEEENPDV